MRKIILTNLKDYFELTAYTFTAIFFLSIMLYLSEYVENNNKEKAKAKAGEVCLEFQMKSLLFWIAMFILSSVYQIISK